jgi:hypothetical protein
MMANTTDPNERWFYLEYMVKMSDDKERQSSDAHRSHDEGGLGLIPDPDAHLTAAEKAEVDRKLLQKLDWKLMPWVRLKLQCRSFCSSCQETHPKA